MKAEFRAIQQYLVSNKPFCKLTKTWQKIHDEHGVGSIGNFQSKAPAIGFTDRDRKFLREWMINETGVDPLSNNALPESRTEAASMGRNEKTAKGLVFGSMLKVARVNGNPIHTDCGDAIAPPNSFIQLEKDRLYLDGETVVVVENGEVIRYWRSLFLPAELKDALLIYRGHDRDARALQELLAEGTTALNVGFYDFDPAGMLMGLSNNHDALLLPADISAWTKGKPVFESINQEDVFWKQGVQLKEAKVRVSGDIALYLEQMEKENIAVMQEHMIAKGFSLALYPIAK